MEYPVNLEHDDNGSVLVSFPDFPEAHTFGDTYEDALRHAVDALATVVDAYIKDRREIPLPSAIVSKYRVTTPAMVDLKVELYRNMRRAKVNKSELARRLDVHPPQVDRLLEMRHSSRLDQFEAAFSALGKRLEVRVADSSSPLSPVLSTRRAVSLGAGVRHKRSARRTAKKR